MEKSILFKGEMVRAVLRGQKTQTRRLHTTPKYAAGDVLWVRETWRPTHWDRDFEQVWIEHQESGTFILAKSFDLWPDSARCESVWENLSIHCKEAGVPIDPDGNFLWPADGTSPVKWRPSIFMPKAACRLWLKVTDVRQEKLQDITEEDAIAEGIENEFWEDGEPQSAVWWNYLDKVWDATLSPIDSFRTLWDSINGDKAPWESNPEISVYKFSEVA